MNDRFKFRAWVVGHYFSENDEEKEVLLKLHDVAVYNDGLIGIDYHSLVADVNKILTNESERESLLENVGCQNLATGDDWYYFEAKFIEQCTGLEDKNGRLIYEGDIVKAEVEEPELKVIGIITFGRYVHDLGFYVEWKGAPAESRKYYPGWRQDLFYWLEEAPLEVIGNIHENPELLETGK